MRKFDTDYKNSFDDYVYYVICHLFTTLGGLMSWTSRFVDYLFLCLLLSWTYSRSFYICKNIWQTNLWDINDINLLFLEIIDNIRRL
jgi:hypothetical protein